MTGLSSGGITFSPLVGRVTKVDAGANESISWPRACSPSLERATDLLKAWWGTWPLRPRTSVFIHGDLQIVHVLDDGDGASGVGDWSEGGQGDAMYDLATLTLALEEQLYGVI